MKKPTPKGKPMTVPSRGAGKGGGGQPMAPLPTPGGPGIPVGTGKPGKGRPF